MTSVTIDGRALAGEAGTTILDAARRAGIRIPALCAEERLGPFDSCGVCTVEVEGRGVVKACSTPIEEGMKIQTHSAAAVEVRKAALELLLSNHWGDCIAPCQAACPARTDCQAYVSLSANGRFLEALKVLYRNLPLPASFGRICPAPCEDACRREIAEEPVQIRHMKRFLGDRRIDYVPSVAPESGRCVAVVGGGPAGLAAAYFLRRHGHAVTVYDAMPKMGGMLRYGIPEYRLPESVIDQELDVLRRMGIVFRSSVRIGADVPYADLEAAHDAIFFGLGAWGTRTMGVPGEAHGAVVQGIEFLRRVNEGERPTLPDRVVVVGGGNTAMDAARCARRLGADVVIVYRRTAEEMPALEHEVREAEDEGVAFRYLTQPIEFLTDGEALRGIRCIRMQLSEPDESGRCRPVPVEGSEWVLPAQGVILGVGQVIDTACLEGTGIERSRDGAILVDPATGQTSRSKIFAGGDVVSGPSIAVEAVAAGHRAADSIDRFLRGEPLSEPPEYCHVKHGVTRDDIGNPATSPRIRTTSRSVGERVGDFAEYEAGLTDDEAVAAAQRCLECGCMAFSECALRDYATGVSAVQETYEGDLPRKLRDERHPFIVRKVGKCVLCGRCVRVCNDVCGIAAIDFCGRGIEAEIQAPFNRAWQDSDCVSCGACVDACPTGALYDRTVLAKQVPLNLERTTTTCVLCGLGCEVDVLTLYGAYMRTVPTDGRNVLCARGRYGWHALRDSDRIAVPMIRSGSALREVSWDEALREAGERLTAAKGRVAVFGTGLLTCEEGWLVARIAEGLRSSPPVFDINACRPHVEIAGERVLRLDQLSEADLIVAVGGRGTHEKVSLDVVLRRQVFRGGRVVGCGASIPGVEDAFDPDELETLLAEFDRRRTALGREARAAQRPVFVLEESHVAPDALEAIARFLVNHPAWGLLFVPATANAVGLRHLGFSEELRTDADAWLTVGSDPVAMVGGRQHLLEVATLVAVSPMHTATTARAHVVLPMRLPYEARGRFIGVRGESALVSAVQSLLPMETWEVLLRLAGRLGIDAVPWSFDALAAAARSEGLAGRGGLTAAGATQAGIAAIADRRLATFGI